MWQLIWLIIGSGICLTMVCMPISFDKLNSKKCGSWYGWLLDLESVLQWYVCRYHLTSWIVRNVAVDMVDYWIWNLSYNGMPISFDKLNSKKCGSWYGWLLDLESVLQWYVCRYHLTSWIVRNVAVDMVDYWIWNLSYNGMYADIIWQAE